MAYLVPDGLPRGDHTDGHNAELETLELLRRRLAPAYTVYHGVHWTRGWMATPVFGEADFVIVNRSGSVLVIEQKRGALEEGASGLSKRYDGQLKSVPSQIHRTLDGLRDKFKRQTGHSLDVDYLLYCPDHRVRKLAAAGLDSERIVDATQAVRLPERITGVLAEGTASAAGQRVARFRWHTNRAGCRRDHRRRPDEAR